MAKRLTLFALRLLLLNIIADILTVIFFGISNEVVQYVIEGIIAAALWIFVWSDAGNKGYDHCKRDKNVRKSAEADRINPAAGETLYTPWFGFAAGLLSQLPTIGMTITYLFLGEAGRETLKVALNLYNMNYLFFMNALPALYPFLYLASSAVIVLVAGLGYLNGPAKLKRLETIIERNKTKKAKRVQDEIKQNRKRKGPKKPDIRRE